MTDTLIDIDQFRREARLWIESNLEPRSHAKTARVSEAKTAEEIAEGRVLQRRLFDAAPATPCAGVAALGRFSI